MCSGMYLPSAIWAVNSHSEQRPDLDIGPAAWHLTALSPHGGLTATSFPGVFSQCATLQFVRCGTSLAGITSLQHDTCFCFGVGCMLESAS